MICAFSDGVCRNVVEIQYSTCSSTMPMSKATSMKQHSDGADPEWGAADEHHLHNTTVKNITWTGVSVTVKDRETKQPRAIVDNVEGIVEAGEWGPSFPVHVSFDETATYTDVQARSALSWVPRDVERRRFSTCSPDAPQMLAMSKAKCSSTAVACHGPIFVP